MQDITSEIALNEGATRRDEDLSLCARCQHPKLEGHVIILNSVQ